MGGWRAKANPWFSPRAIVAPVTPKREIVAVPVGNNSVRYESRIIPYEGDKRLNRGNIDQGLTYDQYKLNKKQRKQRSKRLWKEDYWGEEEEVIIGHRETTHFEWSSTRWSNWSYTSFLDPINSDDNSNLFVKEPENYLTPTVEQIRAKTNYWTQEDMTRVKELARVCYFKMIDDRDYIAEKYKDFDNCGLSSESWNKKREMFDNVYETFVPGFTPLEQAIAINYKIRDIDAYNRRQRAEEKHKSRKFEFRRSNYADADINTQLEMTELSRNHKLEILDKISIIGDLGSQFKVEKDVGEQEVHNSNIHRQKVMRSYEQLHMLDVYQRVLPTYRLKFLTRDLMVNVPVETSEKKQKIIILCDYSGSMNELSKQIWVNAILIDRFKYVIKGEAEVFFSFFVQNPDQLYFQHIKNAADVEKFWSTHSNAPGGSYTNMARIVNHVAEEVRRGKLHNLDIDLSKELPEILIINDGQDEVGQKAFPYKVNAISLMDFSKELKDLCVDTGGKQVRITESNKIYSYSKEGTEVIAE